MITLHATRSSTYYPKLSGAAKAHIGSHGILDTESDLGTRAIKTRHAVCRTDAQHGQGGRAIQSHDMDMYIRTTLGSTHLAGLAVFVQRGLCSCPSKDRRARKVPDPQRNVVSYAV